MSWVRTFLFAILAITFETILGIILALAVDHKFVPNKSFLQTAFIIPMMIAPIAVGVTFKIMYHPIIGVINYFLSWLNIMPVDWLGNSISAFIAILIVEVWRGTPFIFLLVYAGLQTIPKDMYEAAALDGARWGKMFFDITIKWLRPTLLLSIALRILDMFTAFDEIMGATAGGPGTATELVTIHIYKISFTFQQFTVGAAMSIIFLIITVVVSLSILTHAFRLEEE
ncbi:MAG: carbohydrate ABC transporter permease [Bacillota bacterium]